MFYQPTILSRGSVWEEMQGRIGRVCSGGCSVMRESACILSIMGRRSQAAAPAIRLVAMVATNPMVILLSPLVDVDILLVPLFLLGGRSFLRWKNSVIVDCLIVGAMGALCSLREDEMRSSSRDPLPITFRTLLHASTSLSSSS